MPIYEYQCDKCDKISEILQLSSDELPHKCTCGGGLHKIISQSTFRLKGTGWYATDYKNKKKSKKDKCSTGG